MPLERPAKKKEVLLLTGGREVLLNEAQFQKRFRVDGWVRISGDEFGGIKMRDGQFGHFNLKNPNHVEGKRYLIIKIERNGARPAGTKKETPSLLSPDGAFVARCVRVEKNLRYDSVAPEHFEYPVIGVDNKESLPKAIKKRYPSVRDHSDEQMGKEEITYTLFKIEEPPEASSVAQ